jgi:uncharacterized protein YutE (UPF0331/DUF86 family)
MYYVNREQISERLDTIPDIAAALNTLASEWDGGLLHGLAQERALHLAVETVTDVGSCLIDGFILRDASSYEDIVGIIGEANVFPALLLGPLLRLVRLRKPLVQDYYTWQRDALHPMAEELPGVLLTFKTAVETYLEQELPSGS